MASPRSRSDRRAAAWLAAVAALAYLPFDHCHFSATDETGVFDPALALYTRGTLAVEPGMHIFAGHDGRSYSHFAIGQTILALPFIAVADAVSRAVGAERLRAAIGRDDEGYLDTRENPPIFFTSAYAPIASGALVAIFFLFERGLGASRRAALCAAALLGASTYVATHSVYFLQHTTEAISILSGFGALFAWRRTGRIAWLAAGSLLASSVVIVRLPAAVSGPALAGYLAWTLRERAREPGFPAARALAAIALPAAAVGAVHVAVNYAKWGTWIFSPMTAQSFLLHGSLVKGLVGLLLSPGAGLFAYSPLLVLLPLWVPDFWRAHRAEAVAIFAIAASFLYVCGRFVFWHGLWSAPGPRYLFALTPLLLLPLGPWLDTPRPRWQRAIAATLAVLGCAAQIALVTAHWRHTVERMGYEQELTTASQPFLFDPLRAPIAGHVRSLLAGDVDAWWWTLWTGVPGRAPQRALAVALLLAWA
ncbi:MAG TPA: hypothetical protein VKH41_12245, partial [Myxococcota bacterium]|nr:hypothetical protein [Myxococcota bacterium]